MKRAEKKISLVGWGEKQVMIHTLQGCRDPWFSVVENNRITMFGRAAWLAGRFVALPPGGRYTHGTQPAPENAEMVINMRESAFVDAISAIETQDIYLLAEAVSTTYLAQQLMGGEVLPNMGEIAKRYSGRWSLYLFESPQAITPNMKTNAVMAA